MSVYVAVAHGGTERRTARELREDGVVAYVPSVTRWRRISPRRKVRHARPILAGYVFVASAAIERDHAAIVSHRNVIELLGCDGTPQPIEPDWLPQFLVVEALGGFDYTLDRKPKIKVGQIVRIIRGRMAAFGLTGEIAEQRGARFVVATRSGRMEISAQLLEPID